MSTTLRWVFLATLVLHLSQGLAQESVRFLALGDSYTIGESVDKNMRWPLQLEAALESRMGWEIKTTILATTGWRTDDLIQADTGASLGEAFDVVSLLIGVNNQYQGKPFAQYEAELPVLLGLAIAHARGDTSNVFMVSIPDYFYTPFGQQHRTATVSEELDRYNAYARHLCAAWGIQFIDITDISRNGLDEPILVASDGLHPSGEQYSLWVQRILKMRDFSP